MPDYLNEEALSKKFDDIDTKINDLGAKILAALDNHESRLQALEKPTSKPLELRRKLTLPINKDGGLTGAALEIPHSQLINGFSNEYYKPLPNGDVEFYCPAQGATTDNAKYPRTEERWYLADPNNTPVDENGFDKMINMGRGEYTWEEDARISLIDFPLTGKVVIRQSHAVEAPPDWKVIVTASGQIYILCKLTDASTTDDGRIDLTTKDTLIKRSGPSLETFRLYTWFDGNVLKVSLNGGTVHQIAFDKQSLWYPKGDGLYQAGSVPIRAIMHGS